MTNYIKVNDTINTIEGFLVVKGQNCGGLVYLDEYRVDDDGNEILNEKDRMLTLAEIGHIMKEVDGFNHDVRWAEPTKMIVNEADSSHKWTDLEEFYEYYFVEDFVKEDDIIDRHSYECYREEFNGIKRSAKRALEDDNWEEIVRLANTLADLECSANYFEYKEV